MPIWLPKWRSSADDRALLPEAAVRPQADPELAHHSSRGEAYNVSDEPLAWLVAKCIVVGYVGVFDR